MSVRRSILAGSWYPDDPETLKTEIGRFIEKADPPPAKAMHPMGLLCPHAGMVYSGLTAAHGYRSIEGDTRRTVIILSPVHHIPFASYHTISDDAYETPLGLVPVNCDLRNELLQALDCQPLKSDREHAIEIQLPFLQSVLPSFSLLPIMIGHGSFYQIHELIDFLVERMTRDTLILASSDLHHETSYPIVHQKDARVLSALRAFPAEDINTVLSQQSSTVCGRLAIAATAAACRKKGADSFTLFHHTTSADVTGEKDNADYIVGYASGGFK